MQIKQQRAERSWCGWPWTLPATTWQWKPNPVKKKRVAAAWFHGVEAKVKSFPHVPTAFLFKIADTTTTNLAPRKTSHLGAYYQQSSLTVVFFFGKRMKTIGCVWRGQTKKKKVYDHEERRKAKQREKKKRRRKACCWMTLNSQILFAFLFHLAVKSAGGIKLKWKLLKFPYSSLIAQFFSVFTKAVGALLHYQILLVLI